MNPNNHAPRILLSVYACSPEWGSEVGMGWHWVLELAKFCKLDVITESAFRDSIEKNMRSFASANLPQFHYISINERGRKAFWEQGNWSFYYYYREWQKDVLQYVKNSLNEAKEFDAVHQLNLVGFREPGYLWKLNSQNYFWGPICGMGSVPDSFLRTLDWKNCLKYRLKNIINEIQSIGLFRVHRAVKATRTIFVVTPAEKTILQRWYKKRSNHSRRSRNNFAGFLNCAQNQSGQRALISLEWHYGGTQSSESDSGSSCHCPRKRDPCPFKYHRRRSMQRTLAKFGGKTARR